MRTRMSLIALSLQVGLCLCACQSLQSGERPLSVFPAEQVRHGSSRTEALYAVGRFHQGQIRYDKAIEAYNRLLAEYPDHAEARNALGIIFSNQGRFDEAIGEFEKAIRQAPDSARIRNNLGYAYMLRGDVDEAIAVLDAASRLDAGNRQIRENLRIARQRGGKDDPVALARPPEIDGRIAADTGSDTGSDKIRLVTVADNVFALRLPDRKPAKAGPVIPETLVQDAAPMADGRPAAEDLAGAGKGGRLEVANGNGITGLARKMARHLGPARDGAKVRLTNAPPYRLPTTEIQYRPGFEPQARDVQMALRTAIPLIASTRLRPDIQVRLVLGKDVQAVPENLAQTPVPQHSMQLAAVNR